MNAFKLFFFICCLIFYPAKIKGEIQITVKDDSLKKEQNYKQLEEILTEEEGRILTKIAQKLDVSYDFRGKRVAFFCGNSGGRRVPKIDFFNNPLYAPSGYPYPVIYIFEESEVKKTKGYNAAVFFGTKGILPRNSVIRKIRKSKLK